MVTPHVKNFTWNSRMHPKSGGKWHIVFCQVTVINSMTVSRKNLAESSIAHLDIHYDFSKEMNIEKFATTSRAIIR